MENESDRPTLLYIADPMCSWCYGFAPQMDALLTGLDGIVDLKLVMGGLRPFNTETMAKLGNMLRTHWHHVAEASGQPFNHEIFDDHSFVYDTEPPSRAVLVMRQLQPESEYPFFKRIQEAFYRANQNTNDERTYLLLAKQFGVDEDAFSAAYNATETRNATLDEFHFAQRLGVRSFPTTVLLNNGRYTLLARGYALADQIEAAVRQLI